MSRRTLDDTVREHLRTWFAECGVQAAPLRLVSDEYRAIEANHYEPPTVDAMVDISCSSCPKAGIGDHAIKNRATVDTMNTSDSPVSEAYGFGPVGPLVSLGNVSVHAASWV